MPDSAAPLFPDGTCTFCHQDQSEVHYRGEDILRAQLDAQKAESRRLGRKYDCLIRVSGGKDSLSALYRLVTEYDVKVLAFTYQNVFTHPQATENLQRAIKILNVDLVVNTDDSIQKKYVRRNLLRFLSEPAKRLPLLCHLICVGCVEGTRYAAQRLARKHNIHFLMGGGCPIEIDLKYFAPRKAPPGGMEYLGHDLWKVRRMHMIDAAKYPFFWNLRYPRNILRHIMFPNPLDFIRNRLFGFKYETFYSYRKWDEDEILKLLQEKVGWKKPSDRSNTKRFDCDLHLLLNKIRRKYLGLSEKEVEYSMMVHRGMITRDEAERRCATDEKEEDLLLADTLKNVLAGVGLSDRFAQFHELLS